MAGGDQKWLIFRWKSGRNGRLVPEQGTNLETVLCAISPPNTWDSMITWNSMMLDHFCVLSVLLTVIFGAILHFFIQGMAILHSWDGYFTFWERNHPGHYTQELGTDCISTAISLIISSLHQWEASVFFYFVHYMNKKYLKSISRWFPRAGHHWRLPHQQQALFQRHLVWAERVTHEKCEGSRIIQVSVIKRCNRSKNKRCSSFQMKE